MNTKIMITKNITNGIEVLTSIEARKKEGNPYQSERGKTGEIIRRYHPETLSVKVSKIIDVTKDAKTFRLVSTNGNLPVFQAGQYLNIFVNIEGILTSRPISISSSNRQRGYYDITFGRIAKGFISDYFLNEVRVGDEFKTSAPSGNFHHNPVFHKDYCVMIAGGSGVTPFASMVKEVCDRGGDREMHLIYGVRNEELAFFKEEFEAYAKDYPNFTFTLVVSEPGEGYQGTTGFMTDKLIESIVDLKRDPMFYVCGPTNMYNFVDQQLENLNIPKRRIRHEMFGSSQDITKEPAWPQNILADQVFTIDVEGHEPIQAIASENLLTTLERNKIRVNVCCRSGECSLCRIQLTGGQVFMPKGVLLRHADEKYGYIHSCKAYPLSDLKIRF